MTATPILMNDFSRQWLDTYDDVLGAVRMVGESGWYILGKQVEAFESKLCAHVAHKNVVGCGNGLDAIEIGLRALGLVAGQKVLTTPLSAFATSLAIVRAGGIPVYVDVDESGLVDLDLAERCLSEDRSIRFFVPVHLYGHALDLDHLSELVRRFELSVVEDCCQAIGSRSRDRAVGSAGQIGALSFYPTKNLGALGDGGAIITDDPELTTRCRALRDYGQSTKYIHDFLGLNSRLDELHAAILIRAFLPRLAAWTQRRVAIAKSYLAGIGPTTAVRPFPAPAGSKSVWHLFPVMVEPSARTAFIEHLKAQGIQSAIHYPKVISDQRALSNVAYEVYGSLTRAQAIAAGEVSIPIHPYLRDDEVRRVIDAVCSFRTS